jgi:glycosyltransferase involved in cell wall biosynthesis
VVFAGSRGDVEELLPRTDLVVLPTRSEALPTVLMEAAASGVASVATAVGGVPEVVVDGETGWLVDEAAPAPFAAALCAALSDPAEIRRRGRAARMRAESHFSSAAWADRLTACYREVVSA